MWSPITREVPDRPPASLAFQTVQGLPCLLRDSISYLEQKTGAVASAGEGTITYHKHELS